MRPSAPPARPRRNVDHYQTNANFTIYLWTGDGKTKTVVGSLLDDTKPSMTVYQANVTIPAGTAAGAYVLEVSHAPPTRAWRSGDSCEW